MTNEEQERFWRDQYRELHETGPEWLDYATTQERVFTFGACLLVAGPVSGIRCLDAGCGKGGFSRVLRSLGAREVVATDFVESTMQELRSSAPEINWIAGNVNDASFCSGLGRFEAVFAIEILQYVPPETVFRNLWDLVAPGGRLVGVTPNGDNPFVQYTRAQHKGLYRPLGTSELIRALGELPLAADWGVMGFAWREDRVATLYDLLALTREPHWPDPPKRLLYVARKSD